MRIYVSGYKTFEKEPEISMFADKNNLDRFVHPHYYECIELNLNFLYNCLKDIFSSCRPNSAVEVLQQRYKYLRVYLRKKKLFSSEVRVSNTKK